MINKHNNKLWNTTSIWLVHQFYLNNVAVFLKDSYKHMSKGTFTPRLGRLRGLVDTLLDFH